MRLLQVHAPHFTAGVVIGQRAAPIVAYMSTWSEARIRSYCASKGWKVTP